MNGGKFSMSYRNDDGIEAGGGLGKKLLGFGAFFVAAFLAKAIVAGGIGSLARRAPHLKALSSSFCPIPAPQLT
jgi:hypothetical protein